MSYGSDQSPYASPFATTKQPTEAPTKVPGAFVAIWIVSLILGLLGLTVGCCGVISLGGQGMFMSFMEEASKQPGADETQLELMRAALEVQKENIVLILIGLGISLVVSIGLFVGGLLGALKKPISVTILKVVFVMAILSNLMSLPLNLYNSNLTAKAQQAVLDRMEIPEAQQQVINTSQTVAFYIGLVTAIGTAVVMTALYGASLVYLIRSRKLAAYMAARSAAYN